MARIFFPSWAPTREERVKHWAYSELLGWEHIPYQQNRLHHRDFAVDIAVNSHGMRDDEYPVERSEKHRALVLGDSFGWGYGVEHQERFSEILERAHPDWEILNASVSGYGTDQQFLYLEDRGMAFKPDLVLLLFYKNDFEDNAETERYWYFKPAFTLEDGDLTLKNVPVPKASMGQKLDRFLLGRTHLGRRYYSRLNPGKKQDGMDEEEKSKRRQARHELALRLIEAIHAVVKKGGAEFVLVSIPMDDLERSRLQELSQANSIPYLQLDPHFESLEDEVKFPHDSHWNPYGHAVAAMAIDQFLHDLELFGSSENSTSDDHGQYFEIQRGDARSALPEPE